MCSFCVKITLVIQKTSDIVSKKEKIREMAINFWKWYNETSKEQGGSLVAPATAARMIGTTRQYLERLIETGKIKKHYFQDMPFIGMKDINEEIIRRMSKEYENCVITKMSDEEIAIAEEIQRRKEEEENEEIAIAKEIQRREKGEKLED